jgi:hypothetical protein
MEIELMDQPILIIKSASPGPVLGETPKDTLLQIESLLEEEIVEIRNKLQSDEKGVFTNYLTQFNLHLQTESEVTSVILESEWRDQLGDGVVLDQEDNEAEDLIDLEVSELMRVIKITYSQDGQLGQERRKLFRWIADQQQLIPFISGVCSCDYLLISAKDILSSINKLKENLIEK